MPKLFFLMILTALFASADGARANVAPEQAAPSFSLPGADGKTYSLDDFKGKYVVLEWTNHQCPFVVKHYGSGNMQALQREYTGKGVVWLSIVSSAPGKEGHVDAAMAQKLTQDRNASPTAVLLDPDGKIGRLYGAKTTPHMFVINPNGVVIYAGAIDDRRSTDPADISGATNYVKAALDEAMAGKPLTIEATPPYGCSVKY